MWLRGTCSKMARHSNGTGLWHAKWLMVPSVVLVPAKAAALPLLRQPSGFL